MDILAFFILFFGYSKNFLKLLGCECGGLITNIHNLDFIGIRSAFAVFLFVIFFNRIPNVFEIEDFLFDFGKYM